MEPLYQAVSSVSAAAAGDLISAIWEGTILAMGVALCLHMLPRLSAASRSLVWMNAFFLLVLLQVVPVFFGHSAISGVAQMPRIELDSRWSVAIGAVWAILSLWRATQLTASAIRLRGLVHRATPIEIDAATQALLAAASDVRAAELCTSNEVARPSLFGFFKPCILLPPALKEKLTAVELRQVVLHEMEHLRRADDWTNLLQKVALVLFPLNPVLMWVERLLCVERELACDDRVLQASGGGKAYAICLTRLAEYSMLRSSLSLVLGAWERRPELVRRVHRLLRRRPEAMSRMHAKVATASLMAAILGGGFALARCPQFIGFSRPAVVASAAVAPRNANGSFEERTVYGTTGARQGSPRLVEAKAVMPERPVANGAAPKPAHRRAIARSARPRQDDASEQAWLVLTEWTDAAAPPQPVLLKHVLLSFDPRGSYAAVPVAGGWLIVKI
jgi:beta-lactamase regulating signal transducer with metallopeptidase domain